MDTANVIRQLLGEYEQQREENYREEARRRGEACRADIRILELMNDRSDIFRQAQRAAFAHEPIDSKILQARMEAVSAQIREHLVQAGFPEDYLQPIYRCPICRDTGYIGEVIREKCSCLKQRIMDACNANERKGGLGTRSFEQFNLNVFPDEPIAGRKATQRTHMARIERAARRYAEDFPDTAAQNLIFFGPAGLGKTFVADCIATEVMKRAFVVRRVTAYRLMELMRKFQFDGSEAQAVDYIQTCDLLFIDDLGTEPQTKSTSAYLFQIINERNNNDLHTIISTNLTPDQMANLYSDRVASRLMDVCRTQTIEFYGRDLRLIRRN